MLSSNILRCTACFLVAFLTFPGKVGAEPLAVLNFHIADNENHPIAGAEVCAMVWAAKEQDKQTAVTDAQGNCRIALKNPLQKLYEYGRIVVFKEGYGVVGTSIGYKASNQLSLRLPPAGEARGKIVDEAGKPVAGTTINLVSTVPQNRIRSLWLREHPFQTRFNAVTDAQGMWTMKNLPVDGKADVEMADPGFVRNRFMVPVGAGEELVTITAYPAAVLAGRVVYEDGKPAEGISVGASGENTRGMNAGWAGATTDANGTYRLTGLPTGSFTVTTDHHKTAGEWTSVALRNVPARQGATSTAPDLVLIKGAVITGKVMDAVTGRPLPDVHVGGYSAHRPQETEAGVDTIQTGANGIYSLRVAPGDAYIYIQGMPPGYLPPQKSKDARRGDNGVHLTVAAGESKTLDFPLRPGLKVEGTIVTALGDRMSEVTLYLQGPGYGGGEASDAKGHFVIGGLEEGDYRLSASPQWTYEETDSTAQWEVVSPAKVSVPANGPLRVVVQKMKLSTVEGRVVTTAGAPVADATVNAELWLVSGEGGSNDGTRTAHTDAAGHFSLTNVKPGRQVKLTVTKPHHKTISQGKVEYTRGSYQTTDSVLAPLVGKVAARLVDATGAPVAGAVVLSLQGQPGSRTTTDADGKWSLDSLPDGEISIAAIHKTGMAEQKTRSGAALTLTLQPYRAAPAPDSAKGLDLLERVFTESAGTQYYARGTIPGAMAKVDAARALKLLDKDDDPNGWAVAGVLSALAGAQAEKAAEWAPPLLAKIHEPVLHLHAQMTVALQVAEKNPDYAWQLYNQAVAKVTPIDRNAERNILIEQIYSYVSLGSVAARLEQPQAKDMLLQALAAAVKLESRAKGDEGPFGMTDMVVQSAANGDEALLLAVAAAAPPGARVGGLSRAAIEKAATEPELSLRLLEQIEKTPPPVERQNAMNNEPDYAYGLAAKQVIRAIGRRDPAAALRIARQVKSKYHRGMALAFAAQFQEKSLAAELFREAMATVEDFSGGLSAKSRIAAMAYEKDEQLGRELFRTARQQYENSSEPMNDWSRQTLAPLAFYYARVDAGEARQMLEIAYAARRQERAEGANTRLINAEYRGWYVGDLVRAMVAIDAERAQEMAREMNDQERFDTLRKIAQYMMADDKLRSTMAFDRWGAGDTWMPGEPENW